MERTRRFLADFRHGHPFAPTTILDLHTSRALVDCLAAGMKIGTEVSPIERA